MKPIALAAAAMALAVSFPLASMGAPGTPMESLHAVDRAQADPLQNACTADGRWCARLEAAGKQGQDEVDLRIYSRTESGGVTHVALDEDAFIDAPHDALWPHVVILDQGHGALFGVLRTATTGYAGGGGSVTALRLFRIQRGGDTKAAEVLDVPVSGGFVIRACFSERDQEQRAGACHDEYTFDAELTPRREDLAGTPPPLVYTTHATSYPGHVSRSRDSLEGPPLHAEDLVTVTNPRCSFRRTFTFNVQTAQYEPDHPLPDCSDYTDF